MSKYSEQAIDIKNENNSLTKLVNLTPKDSKVLDFGCASGYLGEYLIKNKSCEVTGLEYDQDDAKKSEARGYKKVWGCDLDQDHWEENLEEKKYDVAIFADVLEHLKYPETVLEKTKKLLKKDGKILVSIPNIAHLSVRLELLNGSFEYEDMGILDNTHLKYWTRDSFWKTLNDLDLYVEDLDAVKEEIPEEVLSQYKQQVKSLDELKDDALAYQWIWQIGADKSKEIKRRKDYREKPLIQSQSIFDIKNKRIQKLEEEIQKEQGYIKELEERSENKDIAIRSLEKNSEKKNSEIKKLEDVSEQKSAKIQELDQEILKEQEYIKALEKNSEEKSQWIKHLERDIKSLNQARGQMKMDALPTVDIISLSYNSSRYIEKYFDALEKIDYPKEKIKVWMIDNASADESVVKIEKEIIERKLNYVQLYKSDINTGFAGGNNIAFRHSKADFIFLLNIDTEVTPDCIKTLVDRAKQESEAGMIEAKQIPNEHPKFFDEFSGKTSWCSGACVLIRRQALKNTGFFDEKFFLYCEDVDLSWRMWSQGWSCIYEPKAICKHYTLDIAEHKKGSYTEFYFGLRNGTFMRFIYGNWREFFWYLSRLFWIWLISKHHDKNNKKYALLSLLAPIKNFFYLKKRRKIFQQQGERSAWIKFYRMDYSKLQEKYEKN
jgi:methionine biosynthesis protein MetW